MNTAMVEKRKRKHQPRDGGAADAYQRLAATIGEHRTALANQANSGQAPNVDRLRPLLLVLPDVLHALATFGADPDLLQVAQNQWRLLSEVVTLDVRNSSEPDVQVEWSADPWQVVIAVGKIQLAGVLDADLLVRWLAGWQGHPDG